MCVQSVSLLHLLLLKELCFKLFWLISTNRPGQSAMFVANQKIPMTLLPCREHTGYLDRATFQKRIHKGLHHGFGAVPEGAKD